MDQSIKTLSFERGRYCSLFDIFVIIIKISVKFPRPLLDRLKSYQDNIK